MTEKIYHVDPYARTFEATVLENRPFKGGYEVRLDRTAFYPEGGGQPDDRGTLGELAVVSVRKADGDIWHVLSKPIEQGESVVGEIDWPRRLDYMQQHSGQHVLSAALMEIGGWATVSVHQGSDVTTIEIEGDGFDDKAGHAVESAANRVICDNRPVSAQLVDESEIDSYKLRRPPKVGGAIRLVDIEGYDLVACGGVHLGRTGEIGLVRYVGRETIRGRARTIWKIGQRAHETDRLNAAVVKTVGSILSAPTEGIVDALKRLDAKKTEAEGRVKELRTATTEDVWSHARTEGDTVILETARGKLDADRFAELASNGGLAALLEKDSNGRIYWTLVAGADCDFDFGPIRSVFCRRFDAKGGGKAPLWKGMAEGDLRAETLKRFLRDEMVRP